MHPSTSERRGHYLTVADQGHVLAAFVHRFTREHTPEWAKRANRPEGSTYPVQFASDTEWLVNTWFRVRKDGRLDRRFSACRSEPTWPDNPELRKAA